MLSIGVPDVLFAIQLAAMFYVAVRLGRWLRRERNS